MCCVCLRMSPLQSRVFGIPQLPKTRTPPSRVRFPLAQSSNTTENSRCIYLHEDLLEQSPRITVLLVMSARLFPRVLRQLSATALGTTILETGLYQYATQGQKLYPFDHAKDSLAQSAFSKAINPYQNESLSDIHVARVPLSELPSDLLKNHEQSGSRLIETYCAGLLGGWGKYISPWLTKLGPLTRLTTAFSIQRRIASMKGPSSPNMLLSKAQILDSDFREGSSNLLTNKNFF